MKETTQVENIMKSTRRQRMPEHKAKMADKKRRRENAPPTALQEMVAAEKKAGTFKKLAMNISRHPKGEKRTRDPVYT